MYSVKSGSLLMAGLFAIVHGYIYAADSWDILRKAAISGNELPLTGVYFHQVAHNIHETFRIYRIRNNGEVTERRESMDGLPREVIRAGDRVTSYAPNVNALKSARFTAAKLFPAVLPENIEHIKKSYFLKKLGVDRAANLDCQWYQLKAIDNNRYEQRFCLSKVNALPVKMMILAPGTGEVVEQYAFTSLKKGSPSDPLLCSKPSYLLSHKQNITLNSLSPKGRNAVSKAVNVMGIPKGFYLIKEVVRPFAVGKSDTYHFVYGDGLVSFSIFVQSKSSMAKTPASVFVCGALAIVSATKGDWYLTAVGDLPKSTLDQIINSLQISLK